MDKGKALLKELEEQPDCDAAGLVMEMDFEKRLKQPRLIL
jgi:hypothetical protein